MNTPIIPPAAELLPIALRAYACRPNKRFSDTDGKVAKPPLPASKWVLVFDCETTIDAAQTLRFGTYQLRKNGRLIESGIFYNPDGVTPEELLVLQHHAHVHGLTLRMIRDFVDEVFFDKAYQFRATIIGFNLPFDISRLALTHSTAKVRNNIEAPTMRGGFTFRLSDNKYWPHIRIKHLSRKAALISFAATKARRDTRGMRRRGIDVGIRRGHFIDVATIANALLARSFSLSSLSQFLKIQNPKLEFDDFSGPITDDMVRYAVRDVQATWECYVELRRRFDALKLNRTPLEKIYSEAGIGKAYIKQMGIRPWRECQPDFPPELIGKIMGAYFGGRSEVRTRREVCQVMLCDFLSMYPTVCTLMGLWRFVIAENMTWRDTTGETRNLLADIDLATLQAQPSWGELATLVRVEPDADIFPVRAKYEPTGPATIGANYLTSDQPLWFTLADCIASKLHTGKVPRIVEAITFTPGAVQQGLTPIDIAGNPDYRVDPVQADFFKWVIELRKAVQQQMKSATGDEWERLDTDQHAFKICANSTSYGIWVETNVDAPPERRSVTVHNGTGEPFEFDTDKVEHPGKYFHPLLATLITGAARLMLAITERLVIDQGLDWAFCDTDSMAIARPDGMADHDFTERVQRIVDWFAHLNPYSFGGSILKIEDVNAGLASGSPEPLYCFAISTKRYALFNLAANGTPIMRKVSAHGLGHLRDPYGEDNPPPGFPTPHKSVLKDGTRRWHCDLWHQIVTTALEGHPDQVRLDYHPALCQLAVSRYAATSPMLLAWFNGYNAGKAYCDQVKPFNFLLSMMAGGTIDRTERLYTPRRGRPKKRLPVKPTAPFDTDHAKAIAQAFDRETGQPVPASSLATYADALFQYHISPEAKFLNGNFLDRGRTQRRHIHVRGICLIGKEADNLERQAALGFDPETVIDYSLGHEESAIFADLLDTFVDVMGVAHAARVMGMPRGKVERMLKGDGGGLDVVVLQVLGQKLGRATAKREAGLAELRQRRERDGLRETARQLGVDPSNLRRKLKLQRSPFGEANSGLVHGDKKRGP